MRFLQGMQLQLLLAIGCLAPAALHAQDLKPTVLFENVRIFDGKSDTLSAPSNVLVRGNVIERVATSPIPVDRRADTQIIQGGGRTLMPGLIDAHWHAMMAAVPLPVLLTSDIGYINLAAGKEARNTLMRGFTSVRDLSGPAFGLKRAIDEGLVDGPRIWPSGAMISQTGGHGDFRMPYEVPAARNAALSRGEAINGGVIADGEDEVRKRVREQLMLGATQIKLAAGGGVSSHYDPIDVAQYSEGEFRAAVEAAENWGTYVAVHAYTPRAIQAAVRAGVKVIEHGQLMDEPTARLMAERGVWLSLQAFIDNEFSNPKTGESRAKQLEVYAGTDNAYELAKKYGLKVAWGTDILFEPRMPAHQGAMLATMTRWYKPSEVLKMATSTNAELLALSGPRNPYPGKLGVVEEGALADLLLVEGDPIADVKLIANPEKNFVAIMKNGRLFKNVLP
ncbi:metal-dependent hydrolase family protein [Parapusillimonas granuli]|uniref:Amidohydrolase family protein n=1 Tax=Parapusillimonas granuli TaxID=380911 RepID=A0A853FWF4_9BURK|nr:amidohydrolase family protein [Parapusillimonas granuli]MBB5213914.1 imidazolonepropionase-like amidohydrolase [Parapusillimonas granuli]NYT50335.1 amidohydrolase family protein [Parapusillimonas granuli]